MPSIERPPRAASRPRPRSRCAPIRASSTSGRPCRYSAPASRSVSPAQRTMSPSLVPWPRGTRRSTPYPWRASMSPSFERPAPPYTIIAARFFDGMYVASSSSPSLVVTVTSLLADPEIRHRGRAPDVGVAVREGDREDDQHEDQGRGDDGDRDAERPERVATSPAPAHPAGAPQDHRARHEQDQCRWEGEESRVVVEGGASIRDVVDARESDRADDGTEGHRGRSSHAGTKARVQESQRAEDRERDEAAQEVIACGGARRADGRSCRRR